MCGCKCSAIIIALAISCFFLETWNGMYEWQIFVNIACQAYWNDSDNDFLLHLLFFTGLTQHCISHKELFAQHFPVLFHHITFFNEQMRHFFTLCCLPHSIDATCVKVIRKILQVTAISTFWTKATNFWIFTTKWQKSVRVDRIFFLCFRKKEEEHKKA